MTQTGSCHCGRVAFTVEGEIKGVISCNCSHCVRKGYVLWFVPRENMTLTTPEDNMATYKFNKHVIKHQFCKTCGCAPFGLGTGPDGKATAAINLRCVPAVDLSTLSITPVDGKSF